MKIYVGRGSFVFGELRDSVFDGRFSDQVQRVGAFEEFVPMSLYHLQIMALECIKFVE